MRQVRASKPGWDSYVRFRVRALERLSRLTGGELLLEPGLAAVLPTEPFSRGGLLVSAKVRPEHIDSVLQRAAPQWVALLPPARSLAPVVAALGWDRQEEMSTMATTDLARTPRPPLPSGVEVCAVAVRHGAEGFPLEDAVRLSLLYAHATPPAQRDLELEAQLLRQLPGIRFFAAVDGEGRCLGTAGSRVVDGAALIAGVATAREARGRGIGTALTAAALHAAAERGATEAYLDATPAGVRVYRRLGLKEIGQVLWCERSTPSRLA